MNCEAPRHSEGHRELLLHELFEFGCGELDALILLEPVRNQLHAGEGFFVINHPLQGAPYHRLPLALLLFLLDEVAILRWIFLVLPDYSAHHVPGDAVVLRDVLLEHVPLEIHFCNVISRLRRQLLQRPFFAPLAKARLGPNALLDLCL